MKLEKKKTFNGEILSVIMNLYLLLTGIINHFNIEIDKSLLHVINRSIEIQILD